MIKWADKTNSYLSRDPCILSGISKNTLYNKEILIQVHS